eukprot:m51a1_g6601 hypothetical protein (92) ;mRNA; f:320437-321946
MAMGFLGRIYSCGLAHRDTPGLRAEFERLFSASRVLRDLVEAQNAAVGLERLVSASRVLRDLIDAQNAALRSATRGGSKGDGALNVTQRVF